MSSGGGTIHGTFLDSVADRPDKTALMYKDRGRYVGVTYAALAGAVRIAAGRLAAFGLRKNDVVGIFSSNRPQWIVADLAALSLGAIVVPVYNTLPPDRLKYIINDSSMRMLFVGDADLVSRVDGVRSDVPNLEEVIFLDDWGIRFGRDGAVGDASPEEARADVEDAAAAGSDVLDRVTSSDVATIVYTSGTTGEPKGVMLTHGNIVSNALALIERGSIAPSDVTVSYLPLAHMFERTCGHYVFLFAGATIAYAESRATAVANMAEVRPTVLIAVPRVLAKAYEIARAKIESGPRFKRGVVLRAMTLLNERANRRHRGDRVPAWLDLRCRLYDALVASRFRRIPGGRLRLIVSGGAPLDRRIGKILHVLGFGIVEGYGLTEASPVVSCGRVGEHRLGTVGPPLSGVEVSFRADGEILVRGPNVMRGYLDRPGDTASVLDEEGWLHTGDLGNVDESGNIVVTGRSKDLIVTSYGSNVSPASVEERMATSPYIDQAIVFGDNRKRIVALIVPDRAAVERYAGERGIGWESYEGLLAHYCIRELIEHEIEQANTRAASYERVTAFAVLSDAFSQENGMLTPTLKLRRGRISRAHADRINSLYRELESRHES